MRLFTASRITFGFMECPICKKPMSHPSLAKELEPIYALKAEVEKKAEERLRALGLDKVDEVVKDTKGPYYHNPVAYAMHKFSYYLCYKCGKPYYGGDRACNMEDVKDYDPSELLCPECCPFHAEADCKIHGKEYMYHHSQCFLR